MSDATLQEYQTARIQLSRNYEDGIRNDQALRYGVPVKVWETGCSIREWVGQVMPPRPAGRVVRILREISGLPEAFQNPSYASVAKSLIRKLSLSE